MIGKLPALSDPVKYSGLYIFDFGDHVALGYTAEEVEFLLADPRYAAGTVYKIYRARTDGTLEIRGVNPLAWNLTTGIIFWFRDRRSAEAAYEEFRTRAGETPPPGEFELFMIQKGGDEYPFALVMRYVQELDEALAAWLLRIRFQLGEHVEAGPRSTGGLLTSSTELLRERFGADAFRKSRTRDEVLDAVHQPVQR